MSATDENGQERTYITEREKRRGAEYFQQHARSNRLFLDNHQLQYDDPYLHEG